MTRGFTGIELLTLLIRPLLSVTVSVAVTCIPKRQLIVKFWTGGFRSVEVRPFPKSQAQAVRVVPGAAVLRSLKVQRMKTILPNDPVMIQEPTKRAVDLPVSGSVTVNFRDRWLVAPRSSVTVRSTA
jgi:hypothetical protein